METQKLKESLLKIVEKVDPNTTIEDVYKQLSYLADIEESEEQESRGEVLTQETAEKLSKDWLK
jgi:hypothetical protein